MEQCVSQLWERVYSSVLSLFPGADKSFSAFELAFER